MAISVPNAAEANILTTLKNLILDLDAGIPVPGNVYLFTRDFTPVDGTVLADFTPVGTLELAQPLTGGVITPDSDPAGRALCEWDELTFALLAGGPTVYYGYVVVNGDDDTVLWAERFSAYITLSVGGIPFIMTPRLTLRQE